MCWETNKHGSEERGEMETSSSTLTCEVMIKANIVPVNKFALLIDETEQIIKILTTIINKCKAKN